MVSVSQKPPWIYPSETLHICSHGHRVRDSNWSLACCSPQGSTHDSSPGSIRGTVRGTSLGFQHACGLSPVPLVSALSLGLLTSGAVTREDRRRKVPLRIFRNANNSTPLGIVSIINVAILINLFDLLLLKLFSKADQTCTNAINNGDCPAAGTAVAFIMLSIYQAAFLFWPCRSLRKRHPHQRLCPVLINLMRFTLWPYHLAAANRGCLPTALNHYLSLVLLLQRNFMFFTQSLHFKMTLLFKISLHLKNIRSGAVFKGSHWRILSTVAQKWGCGFVSFVSFGIIKNQKIIFRVSPQRNAEILICKIFILKK